VSASQRMQARPRACCSWASLLSRTARRSAGCGFVVVSCHLVAVTFCMWRGTVLFAPAWRARTAMRAPDARLRRPRAWAARRGRRLAASCPRRSCTACATASSRWPCRCRRPRCCSCCSRPTTPARRPPPTAASRRTARSSTPDSCQMHIAACWCRTVSRKRQPSRAPTHVLASMRMPNERPPLTLMRARRQARCGCCSRRRRAWRWRCRCSCTGRSACGSCRCWRCSCTWPRGTPGLRLCRRVPRPAPLA